MRIKAELAAKGPLPGRVSVEAVSADCFKLLEGLVEWFGQPGRKLAPAIFFIDPYGFKIPGRLLRQLMEFEHVEIIVNVIWRELDMAMAQPDRMGPTLYEIFNGDSWREWSHSTLSDERADRTVEGLKTMTGAQWATYLRMLGPNGATRYLLVHLSNHDSGRDLIKECIWRVCPDGVFAARKSDDPNQTYLIRPTPDLRPLRDWVLRKLPSRWQTLNEDLRATLWRSPHLSDVIRDLKNEGRIIARDYSGRFSRKANPELVAV